MENQNSFSSKIGYVLAAAGSAVGLGNIWRFPYLTAKYGGGIFLLTYLILVLTFGYTMLLTENALGRNTRKGPIGAYRDMSEQKKGWKWIRIGGWLNAITPIIIVPYYCVIGGWVTKYCVAFCTQPVSNFSKDNMIDDKVFANHYFISFITSTWEPIVYFLLFAILLIVVVALGVKKGIERFNKVLMPALIIICIGICIYCCFLPNAGAGFKYYLLPAFDKFSIMTVVEAMGQLFFSLSIAMGIMFTYGSYMRKEDNLVSNVNQVELFDTGVAFLAGLMIIPAVVAFGGEEAATNAGVGLVFMVMPQVFASFPGGQVVGALFFVLVLFAAATSAISLLETNVQSIGQEIKVSRKVAITLAIAEVIVVGVITVLGYSLLSDVHPLSFIEAWKGMDILDSLDFISNSIIMPIGAALTIVLVLGVVGVNKLCESIKGDRKWPREFVYKMCVRWVVLPCLVIILLKAMGIIA